MSRRKKRIDPRQLSLDFDRKLLDEYRVLKEEILNHHEIPPAKSAQSWEEDCIEIAAACKRAIKESGLSREQVVESINEYYGWPPKPTEKNEKSLSIHMFNHYLSKPTEYPIPAYYMYAIHRITGSLEPCRSYADAEKARVISGEEVRELALGKIDENILELQRLRRELRGMR